MAAATFGAPNEVKVLAGGVSALLGQRPAAEHASLGRPIVLEKSCSFDLCDLLCRRQAPSGSFSRKPVHSRDAKYAASTALRSGQHLCRGLLEADSVAGRSDDEAQKAQDETVAAVAANLRSPKRYAPLVKKLHEKLLQSQQPQPRPRPQPQRQREVREAARAGEKARQPEPAKRGPKRQKTKSAQPNDESAADATAVEEEEPAETAVDQKVVRKFLRVEAERKCVYAGDEGTTGSTLVRSLLAATGRITQAQLSEPDADTAKKEEKFRSEIVDAASGLFTDLSDDWRRAGYYDSKTATDFLRAATRTMPDLHYAPPMMLLKKTSKTRRDIKYDLSASKCFDNNGGEPAAIESFEKLETWLMQYDYYDPKRRQYAYETMVLLECDTTSAGDDCFSPILFVRRPTDAAAMLERLQGDPDDAWVDIDGKCHDGADYGAWHDRSTYYASAAMKAYYSAKGVDQPGGKHPQNTPLPLELDGHRRVLVTLDGEYMTGGGKDGGKARAAQLFRYLHYGFRMTLMLQGVPAEDCVTFLSQDGVVCMLLRADLMGKRKEYAKTVTMDSIRELEKWFTAGQEPTFDWAKMQTLSDMGATQCPSSGMPVWDPRTMTADQKSQLEQLVKKIVRDCAARKRPHSEHGSEST